MGPVKARVGVQKLEAARPDAVAEPEVVAPVVPPPAAQETVFGEQPAAQKVALDVTHASAVPVPVKGLGWEAAGVRAPTIDQYTVGQQVLVTPQPQPRPHKPRRGDPAPAVAPQKPTRELCRIIGHDSRGRAVVVPEGKTKAFVAGFHRLTVAQGAADGSAVKPTAGRRGSAAQLLDGIAPEHVHAVDPRLQAAWQLALQRKVVGDTTAQQLVDELTRGGHAVMLVGGAVRDVVKLLAQDPNVTPEALAARFHDLDVATTANVKELEGIITTVTGKPMSAVTWTTYIQDRYGMIGVGERKSGMDIACVKTTARVEKHVVLGTTLKADSATRDFSVNQLYVLLGTQQLVDPTGHGLQDLETSALRFNPDQLQTNNMLALRYMKFRTRGFVPADGEPARVRENAERLLANPATRPTVFAGAFMRILPSEIKDAAGLDAYLAQIQAVLTQDGLADVYEKFVAPGRDAVLAELTLRAGWSRPLE